MSEIQDETPIKVFSKTIVRQFSLQQIISFYYTDPTEIYYSFIKADLKDQLLGEIAKNMSSFINEDQLFINKVQIPLRLVSTELKFQKKNRSEPIIIFQVINELEFNLLRGLNIIELDSEANVLDYPVESIWRFPGKNLFIESPLRYEISGFNVIFSANQSETIGGFEKYLFSNNFKNN